MAGSRSGTGSERGCGSPSTKKTGDWNVVIYRYGASRLVVGPLRSVHREATDGQRIVVRAVGQRRNVPAEARDARGATKISKDRLERARPGTRYYPATVAAALGTCDEARVADGHEGRTPDPAADCSRARGHDRRDAGGYRCGFAKMTCIVDSGDAYPCI